MTVVETPTLIAPHGGRLVDRAGPRPESINRLEQLQLTSRELSDLDMLASGALSPLEGFMGRNDYERVVEEMRLERGLVWALPVCLAVDNPPRGEEVALTDERGWRRVVGFQTRNPIHRAHEYLTKSALETVDGLLIHPLVGETKSDDVPAATRVECYRVLVENYYPAERVLVSAFPAAMRYAGPREAIWHAICRKNYGCSHFIVGRDHAGVGDYYGTYDAQLIFDDFEPHELDVEPMFFEHSFWCRACGSMASAKTCPHDREHHVLLSGTRVRELLAAGELPPVEFSRPEVAAVLVDHYADAENG